MKLTSTQAAAVKQRVNIDPIDDENPVIEPLRQAFGDHTFYIVSDGLFVLEEVTEQDGDSEQARFVMVAAWANEEKNALQPIEPQPTNTVIDLAGGDAPAAENGGDAG
jgi:hypothetical protein